MDTVYIVKEINPQVVVDGFNIIFERLAVGMIMLVGVGVILYVLVLLIMLTIGYIRGCIHARKRRRDDSSRR